MAVIRADNITFFYDGAKKPSLEDVTAEVKGGVKTALLGANGAGKSTFFYHFNGVVKPAKGTVYVMDEPINYRKKGLRKVRSKVAVVLQNPDDQVFGQTVQDDVAYGPRNIKLPEDEVKRRVDKALFQTGLEEFRERNTLQLSYGQRKRLALAGALAMEPEVLVMDEPTAGLDPQMAFDLMELADQLHANGTTIILSTHDIDLAYTWAQEILVIGKGHVIYSGEPEPFYSDPIMVHSAGIMQPSMFVVNSNLARMGSFAEAPYPRTESQMVSKICSGPKGKLTLVPLGKYTGEAAANVGVYGTNARKKLIDDGMKADYIFNGFESCVMDCLKGSDSVLVYDEDCENLVKSKLEELKAFGTDLECEYL